MPCTRERFGFLALHRLHRADIGTRDERFAGTGENQAAHLLLDRFVHTGRNRRHDFGIECVVLVGTVDGQNRNVALVLQ